MSKVRDLAFMVLATIILSACSSLSSIIQPTDEMADGLTYFMPKRDFLVTVTIESSKVKAVSFGVTPVYPDLSKQYVLKYGFNLFGKNTLEIGVNDKGLLTSAKSTTISKVNEAFKNLASSLGHINGLGVVGSPPPSCSTDGEYKFIYGGTGKYNACGLVINITDHVSKTVVQHSKDIKTEYSGVFYRQNEPYKIEASNGSISTSSIVYSPSNSKVHFIPVSKTFLANNEADFSFKEGIPTKYKQETDSEFVSLFKLPADIIGGYFSGVGKIFDSFKTTDKKEADALSESLKLELAKKKYDVCIAAIEAKNDDLIKELGCQ